MSVLFNNKVVFGTCNSCFTIAALPPPPLHTHTNVLAVRRLSAVILVTVVTLLNGTAAALSLDFFINQVQEIYVRMCA